MKIRDGSFVTRSVPLSPCVVRDGSFSGLGQRFGRVAWTWEWLCLPRAAVSPVWGRGLTARLCLGSRWLCLKGRFGRPGAEAWPRGSVLSGSFAGPRQNFAAFFCRGPHFSRSTTESLHFSLYQAGINRSWDRVPLSQETSFFIQGRTIIPFSFSDVFSPCQFSFPF